MQPSSRNLLELNLWISRPRSVMALLGTWGQVHLGLLLARCRGNRSSAGTVRSIVDDRSDGHIQELDPPSIGFFVEEVWAKAWSLWDVRVCRDAHADRDVSLIRRPAKTSGSNGCQPRLPIDGSRPACRHPSVALV